MKLFRSSNSQMKFRKDDINYEAKKDDTKPNPRGGSNKDPSSKLPYSLIDEIRPV